MWSMIALTPYQSLARGVYEAQFQFTLNGVMHSYGWRLQVG